MVNCEIIFDATVDTVTIWPGERIDFILIANQKPGNYWIRYRGYGECQKSNDSAGVFQSALLRYDNVPLREPQSRVSWNFPEQNKITRVNS